MRDPLHSPAQSPNFLPEQMHLGSFTTYAEAQAVVDRLARSNFGPEHTQIIGTRLSQVHPTHQWLPRRLAVLYRVAAGAWCVLFIALLLHLLQSQESTKSLLFGLGWGVVFGTAFCLITNGLIARSRARRFKSLTVSATFDVLVKTRHYTQAQDLLTR